MKNLERAQEEMRRRVKRTKEDRCLRRSHRDTSIYIQYLGGATLKQLAALFSISFQHVKRIVDSYANSGDPLFWRQNAIDAEKERHEIAETLMSYPAVCIYCGRNSVVPDKRTGYLPPCHLCKHLIAVLKKRNMILWDYHKLLLSQDYKCAACGSPFELGKESPFIDASCALLCRNCKGK